jgi:hypothetical protein
MANQHKSLVYASAALVLLAGCSSASPPEEQEFSTEKQNLAAGTESQSSTSGATDPQPSKSGDPSPPGTPAPPTPPGGPAKGTQGPPVDCVSGVLGNGTCQSDDTYKNEATSLCAAKYKVFSSFTVEVANDCAKGSTVAKYSCCK